MDRSSHLTLAQECWKRILKEGDVAIDATCGNGYDTLFLAKMKLSALFAIDIQAAAIENTKRRLLENVDEKEMAKVVFCQMSHEDLKKIPYPKSPRLIVYNLGYRPGGDKTATTRTESTLSSMASALSVLDKKKGAVSITCYPGHEEGKREEDALLHLAASLPSSQWEVWHHFRPNRPNSPSLLWIARVETI